MDNLILFDFSNLAHRCIYLKQIEAASENPEYALWHYMVFQAMYDYVIQTAEDFGGTFDVVLALDSHSSYWRKDIYHPYKGDRLVKKAIDGWIGRASMRNLTYSPETSGNACRGKL